MKTSYMLCLILFTVTINPIIAQKSIEEAIGKKAMKTIDFSDTIWAYELNPLATADEDKLRVGGFVATERIGIVANEAIAPFLQSLKKGDEFNWSGMETRIPFTPEVAFEFEKSGKIVIALLDFDANEVGIRYGKQLYRFEFDGRLRNELLQWLKNTFSYQETFIKIE